MMFTKDGYDVKTLEPKTFHKHIGIVSQEPMLFGTTIAKNIAYGRDDIPLEKIIEVLHSKLNIYQINY